MSACLQLDVGNSSAKWRLVLDGVVSARGSYSSDDHNAREALLDCCSSLEQIWVSSVAGPAAEAELSKLLQQRWGVAPWFARSQAQTRDLVNSYRDPSRMGVDRWLAMLGARRLNPGRCCVVDSGSATTIDLVAASGEHEGGYIFPGAALMERALLLDTDRVRFAEDVGYGLAPGSSTAEAVRHGIALAQVGAVSRVLQACGTDQPALVFSGGGGEALMGLLGSGGEYVADLVFEGLEVLAEADS